MFARAGLLLALSLVALDARAQGRAPAAAAPYATRYLLDLSGGVKFILTPHLLVAAGLDIPLVFGEGTAFFINVVGRIAYFF